MSPGVEQQADFLVSKSEPERAYGKFWDGEVASSKNKFSQNFRLEEGHRSWVGRDAISRVTCRLPTPRLDSRHLMEGLDNNPALSV